MSLTPKADVHDGVADLFGKGDDDALLLCPLDNR